MSEASRDIAGVIAPPPLIFAGPLLGGWLLGRAVARPDVPRPARLAGGVLAVAGLALGGWGFVSMRRAGTQVRPTEPSTRLVTHGPFQFSRNPLYLSMTLLYVGLALAANATLALPLLPIVVAVVQRGVIQREERYLGRTFGAEYGAYRQRVRR